MAGYLALIIGVQALVAPPQWLHLPVQRELRCASPHLLARRSPQSSARNGRASVRNKQDDARAQRAAVAAEAEAKREKQYKARKAGVLLLKEYAALSRKRAARRQGEASAPSSAAPAQQVQKGFFSRMPSIPRTSSPPPAPPADPSPTYSPTSSPPPVVKESIFGTLASLAAAKVELAVWRQRDELAAKLEEVQRTLDSVRGR